MAEAKQLEDLFPNIRKELIVKVYNACNADLSFAASQLADLGDGNIGAFMYAFKLDHHRSVFNLLKNFYPKLKPTFPCFLCSGCIIACKVDLMQQFSMKSQTLKCTKNINFCSHRLKIRKYSSFLPFLG